MRNHGKVASNLKRLRLMKILLFILSVCVIYACSNKAELLSRLEKNATQLLDVRQNVEFKSNKNFPATDIVNIGPGLFQLLHSKQTTNDYIKIYVCEGDLFGEGGAVTHSIKYTSKLNGKHLIVRLRYDDEMDKFHIVGYSGMIE